MEKTPRTLFNYKDRPKVISVRTRDWAKERHQGRARIIRIMPSLITSQSLDGRGKVLKIRVENVETGQVLDIPMDQTLTLLFRDAFLKIIEGWEFETPQAGAFLPTKEE